MGTRQLVVKMPRVYIRRHAKYGGRYFSEGATLVEISSKEGCLSRMYSNSLTESQRIGCHVKKHFESSTLGILTLLLGTTPGEAAPPRDVSRLPRLLGVKS